jgi:integrase
VASFKKTTTGWRADIFKKGVRRSKTRRSKQEAIAWANQVEHEIDLGFHISGAAPVNATMRNLLERYRDEVSPTKRGHRWEVTRLNQMIRDPFLAPVKLSDAGPRHFSAWRDQRLKEVSGSTVNREFNLLSHACKIGWREREWLNSHPMEGISRPRENRPRNRVFTPDEIKEYADASGYSLAKPPVTTQSRVGAMFLFACETAMRGGEIASIKPEDIDFEKRVIHIPKTKTDVPRWVPLSTTAVKILKHVLAFTGGKPTVFGVTSSQRDALSRKVRDKAGLVNFHFHDTRRTALTRLAQVFGPMDLAKISGHSDLKILQTVYYAPDPSNLVSKLD